MIQRADTERFYETDVITNNALVFAKWKNL